MKLRFRTLSIIALALTPSWPTAMPTTGPPPLVPNSLAIIDLDLLVLLRPDGSQFAGGRLEENTLVPLRPGSITEILAGGPFLPDAARGIVTGVVSFHGEPLLVAAAPILTSNGTGPARGALIMGRLLTRDRLKRIGDSVRLPLDLLRAGCTPG